jgi:hypothetical protein
MKKLSDIWYEAVKTGKRTFEEVPRLLKPRIKAMLEEREMTHEEFIEAIKQ